ncbi:hypothetical protein SAY86_029470 [Trapa natans]|uniref:Uncharacterized protein n=1 Tax=Trapa natans TaxID=22666 RepID=A0AAN7M3R1_TRANT|nr:hypothetical protein SAY86_029470 [Trapa natans]
MAERDGDGGRHPYGNLRPPVVQRGHWNGSSAHPQASQARSPRSSSLITVGSRRGTSLTTTARLPRLRGCLHRSNLHPLAAEQGGLMLSIALSDPLCDVLLIEAGFFQASCANGLHKSGGIQAVEVVAADEVEVELELELEEVAEPTPLRSLGNRTDTVLVIEPTTIGKTEIIVFSVVKNDGSERTANMISFMNAWTKSVNLRRYEERLVVELDEDEDEDDDELEEVIVTRPEKVAIP